MHAFTVVFLIALAVTTATRMWLAGRHIRHVLAYRDDVPAEFAASVTLSAHQKAADYTVAKTRLGRWETLVSVALLLVFTLGGGLQFLADAWSGAFRAGGYAHGIALVASVAVISGIVDLPFSVYRVFVVEERFGFNRMTAGLFIADLAKQITLGAALGLPLLFAVLWLMDRMGAYWWLYVWLAWMAFNLVILAIYPTVIAPLFNKFTPLADESLRVRIEALLARCGFRAKGLFVMDGSKRSSHGNAYFTGLGAAKRIVFFDTLMQRLAPQEIEAVLAHELGHFKHRHVIKRIAMVSVVSLVFLAALGYLIRQDWFFQGLGVQTPSTALALLLFFMALPAFTFLFHPLASVYSRRHEYEADAYAARQASAGDLVHALVKLYQDNAATLTPDPVHSAFYDSHPPAALRVARLQAFSRPRPT
ncbi:MAG: M48 family metallopeptidase [Betaproteobacteria bacterium]|jgi:STE24 endopeptidase|nr:M48 family metallopeptidase [Betaproteobacteria bacterium]